MCPLVGERCRRGIVVRPIMPSEGVMLTRIAVDCRVRFGGSCRFDLSNAPIEINEFVATCRSWEFRPADHQTFIPPSTTISTPVTYELSSQARNKASDNLFEKEVVRTSLFIGSS